MTDPNLIRTYDYISRNEYEARHDEMIQNLSNLSKTVQSYIENSHKLDIRITSLEAYFKDTIFLIKWVGGILSTVLTGILVTVIGLYLHLFLL